MKRKLLSLAVALLCSVGLFAQASYNHTWTSGAEVAAGSDYFLYNIGAKKFLDNGMNWGTRATVDNAGKALTLALNEGKYSIYTGVKTRYSAGGGGDYFSDGYLDKAVAYYTFTPVSLDGYTNVYTISDGTNYLVYQTDAEGDNPACNMTSLSGTNNDYWLLVTKDQRKAVGDYTFMLDNTCFNRPWEYKAWILTISSTGTDGNATPNQSGGLVGNRCAESFRNAFTYLQNATGTVINGKYKLYCQGFYRKDGGSDASQISLNTATADMKVLNGNSEGTTENMNGASTAFSAGQYVNSVEAIVTSGSLSVGIKNTNNMNWVIWNNFYLEYLGNNVECYSPAEFTSGDEADKDAWYAFEIEDAGMYKITSSKAATIYYTQDDSDDADDDVESETIASDEGSFYKYLADGTTLYFKSSENADITIVKENYVRNYAPEATDFSSSKAVTEDTWYAVTIGTAGYYKVSSTNAVTLSYTQTATKDADDDDFTGLDIAAARSSLVNLSANTLYFKSNAASSIKIVALANGMDVTDVFITNPSFSSTYTTGWTVDGTAPNAYNSTYGAYEAYHLTGGLHQDLTGLPNGIYKVTMQAASRIDRGSSGTFNLFATTSNGTTKSPATIASHDDFATMAKAFNDDATYARIETYAVVTDGNLTIGHYESNANTWPVFDNYTLTYYGTSSEAYALALASEASKALVSINGMTDGTLKTALNSAYTERNAGATLANIQWMTFISSSASELSQASNLSIAANAIANVTYTETTDGSHTTFASAISTFNTTVAGASSVETITSAISTLKAAIKTYINNAEPSNEGDYFDITCLIENPSFANNNATGWSGDTPVFELYGNAEFFNKNFDFYQNITGLANGSYQLSVQAFCRPGDNGNTTAGAYYDYTQGINNITAELYVNSDASTIGNIYSYKNNTTGAKVVDNDFNCNIASDNYWVPNNMKGAGLYFEDGAYVTEVAALVEDGNLKIGFREASKKTNQWVIFDNFKLYYYGSSKLVYLKQYLPQLKAEVSADLANGAYANVLVSSEDEALDAALVADPASETEEAYETVIDNLRTAQTNFRAAATPYNAIVAEQAASAMTKISENVGTGVFQYNESTNNSLYSAYETARASVTGYTFTTSSTASGAQTLLDALNEAVENYNNQTLNAPVEGQRIKIVNCTASSAFDFSGNALTFYANPEQSEGGYGYKYSLAPNNAYAQNFIFTPVAGQKNQYIMSFIDNDGTTRYVCTQYGYNENKSGEKTRIRTTTNSEYALKVRVDVTTTANVWKLYNTEAGKNIGTNGKDNNDFFTNADRSDLTLSVAEKASVTVSAKAGKYGTVIFPFTPDVSEGFDGITFYSINGINNVTNRVQLNEVTTPVANTPYIVMNTSGANFSKAVSGWGTAYKDSYDSGDTDIKLTGVYTAATIAASAGNTTNYVLQTPTSGDYEGIQAFYKVDADFTATANKCYLTVTAAGVKAFFLDFSDTDAINSVEAIQNDNTVIYNLAGQRVQKAQKGLYIVNGKKVVIK